MIGLGEKERSQMNNNKNGKIVLDKAEENKDEEKPSQFQSIFIAVLFAHKTHRRWFVLSSRKLQ